MHNLEGTPNRLINETSPYLLQHAYNPVDWWPWCEDAFASAVARDLPIFLSIGYSTCHWCHVMERESFEDAEVAAFLNQHFISIKVDKEERPDIDSIYMSVCHAMTGSGGWPLTILMSPERLPFYAGTYFPKRGVPGLTGLMELLTAVSKAWRGDRENLLASGGKIAGALRGQQALRGEPSLLLIEQAAAGFLNSFDTNYGGFGRAPKFPSPHNLLFLIRHFGITGDNLSLTVAAKTLRQMYRGGIFDHIGYGFSRYSTDNMWLVPHFEKMLYDNAMLVMAYAEVFWATGDGFYQDVAEKTLDYVYRELTGPEGGFYCAQDADSDGVEGKYYVFTPDEITGILGEADGKLFCRRFNITQRGNFEGFSIPNLIDAGEDVADPEWLAEALHKLRTYRQCRAALLTDDKMLTSWNGLMIAACAHAYRIFGDERHLIAAKRALQFLDEHMTLPNGRLCISYRGGVSKGDALLDDYAFTIWALLELYEATFEPIYLKRAAARAELMLLLFLDSEDGGFFLTPGTNADLLFRPRESYDGAIPSGNSVAAWCLVKLAALTADPRWRDAASIQLEFMSGAAADYPVGFSFFLSALQLAICPARELVCVVNDEEAVQAVLGILRCKYNPNLTVLVKNAANADELAEVSVFTKDYKVIHEEPTFYICENHSCSAPFAGFDSLMERL